MSDHRFESVAPSPAHFRVVRVFISSTFRDFGEERRLLVNEVFPELRRRARQRLVEVIEVDLRWGITEEEADRGNTLAICLRELDRARPYFVGMLGERYGWVPEAGQVPASVVEAYPWLRDKRGAASITEFEILSCVLGAPASESRALFYFRSARYADDRGPDFRSVDPDEIERLHRLKSIVESSRLPVSRDYPNPEAFAAQVLEDLWRRIDRDYPAQLVPSGVERERQLHQVWADGRRRVFIQRQRCLDELDREVAQTAADQAGRDSAPIALFGVGGVGKSAVLAAWTGRHGHAFPTDLIFEHYGQAEGCRGSVGWVRARLQAWISELLGNAPSKLESMRPVEVIETDEVSDAPIDDLLAELSRFVCRSGRRAIVVLDGLQVESDGRWGWWIPDRIPPGVALVVAPAGEGSREFTASRFGRIVELGELTQTERCELVDRLLAHHFKRLAADSVTRIAASATTGKPGTLCWMLDEMRRLASHDDLDRWVCRIEACGSEVQWIDSVLDSVLEREQVDLADGEVGRMLATLVLASTGIHENDLAEIACVPLRSVVLVQHRLGELLESDQSRLRIAQEQFRARAQQRCLATQDELRRRALLDARWWIRKLESADASMEQAVPEALSLLLKAQDPEQLRSCLLKPLILWNVDCLSRDLRERVAAFADQASVDLEATASEALGGQLSAFCTGPSAAARVLALSDMLAHARHFGELHEQILDAALAEHRDAIVGSDMQLLRNAKASLLQARGRSDEACSEFAIALRARQNFPDWPNGQDLSVMSNLVVALVRARRHSEALQCAEMFLGLVRRRGGLIARDAEAFLLSSRAVVLRQIGRSDDALRESLEALRLLGQYSGKHAARRFVCIANHALILLDRKQSVEAERILREQMDLVRVAFGSNSPEYGRQLTLLGKSLAAQGESVEALQLFREAVGMLSDAPGSDLEYSGALNQLAALLLRTGDVSGAITSLEALLRHFRSRPQVDLEMEERTLHDLACAYAQAGRWAEAADSWEAIFRLLGGADAPRTVSDERAEQLLMIILNAIQSRRRGGHSSVDLLVLGKAWRGRIAELWALTPEAAARRKAICNHYDELARHASA